MARFLRRAAVSIALLSLVGMRGGAQSAPAPAQQQQAQQPPAAQQPPPNSQQPPPADPNQPPTFRAGINFVRVDVIVSDKAGSPVGDLQLADFDVTEDGKPQRIESFKLVKLDGGTSAAAKEPPRQIRTD